MKRHQALIPLSHDHHHALVEARRLRRAARSGAPERREAAVTFLAFFARETRRHFREEEEVVFPLLVGADGPAGELLGRALLEHQRLHALANGLAEDLTADDAPPAQMRKLATELEAHIRFEERTLFPLIEEVTPDERLRRLEHAAPTTVGVIPAEGKGPLWATETEDLNATLLGWPAGAGTPEHVNSERDVLVVVLSGSAIVTIDGQRRLVESGEPVVIEKGKTRQIAAGPEGARYLSVHMRRLPLQIARAPARSGRRR